MQLTITITETDLKRLVVEHIQRQLGAIALDPKFLTIEVKSKQNYKSEWEQASFRAVYHHQE